MQILCPWDNPNNLSETLKVRKKIQCKKTGNFCLFFKNRTLKPKNRTWEPKTVFAWEI